MHYKEKTMNTFAQNLRDLRTENNLKQSQLANVLFVGPQSISNWENNVSKPDYDMLIKIANYFQVSTDYLLGVSDI